MTVEKKTIGTGITKRTISAAKLNLDKAQTPQDISDFVRLLDQASANDLERIEALAFKVLTDHGLLTAGHRWAMDADGKTRQALEKRSKPKVRYFGALSAIADAKGFEIDSDCGYAARLADNIRWVKAARRKSDVVYSAILIGALWTQWAMKSAHEKSAISGAALRKAKGSSREHVHAPKAREMYDRLPSKLSTLSKAKIISKKLGMKIGTVRNAIRRKKSVQLG